MRQSYRVLLFLLVTTLSITNGFGQKIRTSWKVTASNCNQKIAVGVKGTVLWVTGNHMPGPDMPKPAPMPYANKLVGIFPLTKLNETVEGQSAGFYRQLKNKPLQVVKTNKQGCYQVRIMPGTYSIMVWERNQWYANSFQGGGEINPVTVTAGQIANLDLEVNYTAVY